MRSYLFPPRTMYPKEAEVGDTIFFERPHEGDHKAAPEWEPMPGGALARCRRCNTPLAMTLVVCGTIIPAAQLSWVVQVGQEVGLNPADLFAN